MAVGNIKIPNSNEVCLFIYTGVNAFYDSSRTPLSSNLFILQSDAF